MFDHIGSKLKTLAAVIFALMFAGALIAAVAAMASGQALAGLIMLLVGMLAAWLCNVGLYAFGELVDNSAKLVQQNQQLISLLKAEKTGTASAASKTTNGVPSRVNHYTSAVPIQTYGWVCECGKRNPDHVDYCLACSGRKP